MPPSMAICSIAGSLAKIKVRRLRVDGGCALANRIGIEISVLVRMSRSAVAVAHHFMDLSVQQFASSIAEHQNVSWKVRGMSQQSVDFIVEDETKIKYKIRTRVRRVLERGGLYIVPVSTIRRRMRTKFVRGAETRLHIIRTAADLFHKQGARVTSPDEIIEASRTGKGQFYHYFGSKQGLIHEVLQTYLDEIKTGASRINYEINSWRDLKKWFAAQVELQKSYHMMRGCPFGTLGNEVNDNDELVRQDLSLIFEVIKNKLSAFFVREKAKGRLAKHANAERMADFCIASMQGAMLMGKIKRSGQTAETTVQEALAHLKSYLVRV
jgi:TetR/AcrR family transcriptional regulator, transcriptional repressor for nem operon